MASWAVVSEQVVWISPLATAFIVVCERCANEGELFPSVEGRLSLEYMRGTVQCPFGHRILVERDGR